MTDPFDAMLISSATVLVRDIADTADAYGTSDPTFSNATPGSGSGFGGTTLNSVNPAPCRVALGKGKVKEFKSDKKVAVNYREVFMRPWYDSTGKLIGPHHWLQISGVDGTSILYQIIQVDNPSGLNHHLEVWCEIYQP